MYWRNNANMACRPRDEKVGVAAHFLQLMMPESSDKLDIPFM